MLIVNRISVEIYAGNDVHLLSHSIPSVSVAGSRGDTPPGSQPVESWLSGAGALSL